jgi:hypothetical protein
VTREVSDAELRLAQSLGERNCRAGSPCLFERRLGDGRVLQVLPWRCAGLQLSVGAGDGYYTDCWIYDAEQYADQVDDGWRAALGWDGQGEPDGWYRHPQSGRRRPGGDRAKEYVRPNRKQRRAFEAGKRSAKTGELPPEYAELIGRMARLILEWIEQEPGLPDLRWHDMTADKTMVIGGLSGAALKYLAGSPDAIRLCEWLDERTGGEATLYQATWALKLAGQLPGGPAPETSHESDAYKTFLRLADRAAQHGDRVAASPCGHCGKELDGATSDGGRRPRPGDLTVCVYCCGLNKIDADLRLTKLTEEQVDALPLEVAVRLREMQALMRSALMKAFAGKARGPVPEA